MNKKKIIWGKNACKYNKNKLTIWEKNVYMKLKTMYT